MKVFTIRLIIISIIIILFTGCTANNTNIPTPEKSIKTIQKILGLPERPVQFIEETTMVNSPDGKLIVSNYRDEDGINYYVDIQTNIVVEIDARSKLSSISNQVLSIPEEELKKIAETCANKIIQNFDKIKNGLSFEGTNKGDNYFYSWSKEIKEGSSMPEFLQFGYYKNGELFAYYNTLQLER